MKRILQQCCCHFLLCLACSLYHKMSAFSTEQSGAVEACWAHNPEVRGSKPRSANNNFIAIYNSSAPVFTDTDKIYQILAKGLHRLVKYLCFIASIYFQVILNWNKLTSAPTRIKPRNAVLRTSNKY